MAPLSASGAALLTAQELLRIASDLFAALMAVDHPFTGADHDRAKSLHLILAEVAGRAARLFALEMPPCSCSCSCGASFQTPEELDEHFWQVFVPLDDQGLDGKPHAELARAAGETR